MTATLYDAGPDSCVIALGLIRATYSRRAVERVLKWLDTEVDVPVSDDMCVWLGLYVVPVGVLRAAAAEMTCIREASGQAVARGSQPALDFGEGA